jgi:hypothetical protein
MHGYAQTNIQLFNQLRSEGYSESDRERVREAYEFATRLFTGLFLPSGKTFIDHLVGTASVLASLHVRVELVIAGLIHAAYLHGNFGGIRKGISEGTRKQVRVAVGAVVEEYVVRYERMPWYPQISPVLCDAVDDMDPVDRDVLLIHLANDLEHNLDLGCLYRDNWHRHMKQYGPEMVLLGERAGFLSLAAEMASVFETAISAQGVLEPRIRTIHDSAFLLVPSSYCERFGAMYLPKVRRLYSKMINQNRWLRWRLRKLKQLLLRTVSVRSGIISK